jgi:hypothetical protein
MDAKIGSYGKTRCSRNEDFESDSCLQIITRNDGIITQLKLKEQGVS